MRKTELVMVRVGDHLVPASPYDRDVLMERVPQGTPIQFTAQQPRNLRFHRWWRVLIAEVAANHEEYDTAEKLQFTLKWRMGLFERVTVNERTGETQVMLKSTSFAAMDEIAYRDYVNHALDIIVRDILPGMKRADLIHHVDLRSRLRLKDLIGNV